MSVEVINRSALEGLQLKSTVTTTLQNSEVARAISADLQSERGFSETLLVKVVRNASINPQELRALIRDLQSEMLSLLDANPQLFLSYTKAQLILASELKRQVKTLPLALGAQ